MEVCSLASSSSGNCFFVGDKKTGILIDAGISSKRIVNSLLSIGKKPQQIKAVFITHEHSDHIKGVDVFCRNFNIPVFTNEKTQNNSFLCSDSKLIKVFENNEDFKLGNFEILALKKSHKAADPVIFKIKSNNKIVSVITDAGYCCKNVHETIKDSNFIFLESNHDVKMLHEGPYPWHVKNWIKSDLGHLSNLQASLGVLEHSTPKLKQIVLSHISRTNNIPELAKKTLKNLLKERKDTNIDISLALDNQPTNLFVV